MRAPSVWKISQIQSVIRNMKIHFHIDMRLDCKKSNNFSDIFNSHTTGEHSFSFCTLSGSFLSLFYSNSLMLSVWPALQHTHHLWNPPQDHKFDIMEMPVLSPPYGSGFIITYTACSFAFTLPCQSSVNVISKTSIRHENLALKLF